MFGIVLGVISIALMAWFVNLVAAFLTLLAIALLRDRVHDHAQAHDPAEHRDRRRGRGAAAGDRLGRGHRAVGIPALLLFALVFYWTPPHFWALSLRIRKDYEAARRADAAGRPGRPRDRPPDRAVHGPAGRDSLVFCAVARMGPIYLVAAVGLGAVFLWRAPTLWRAGDLAGGLARPGDPPVQVLDQLPDAAVRRGGRRQPGRGPADLAAREGQPSPTGAARLGIAARRSPSRPLRVDRASARPDRRATRPRPTVAARRRSRPQQSRDQHVFLGRGPRPPERQPTGSRAWSSALARRGRMADEVRSGPRRWAAGREHQREPRRTTSTALRVRARPSRAVLRGQC